MASKTPSRTQLLSSPEARLLGQINRGFSDAWWENYQVLIRKRDEGVLSKTELKELIHLTDKVERQEAKRLKALVSLANLRGQSLRSLMKELGLPWRTNG